MNSYKKFLIALLTTALLNIYYASSNIEIIDCGVTIEESKHVVDRHNDYRKLVATGKVPNQPKAIDLKRIKWDNKLAEQAEKVARTGVFEHIKIYDKRWPYVGQNLHLHSSGKNSTDINWDKCLSSWFLEHEAYVYGPMVIGEKCGHYTQMIWATSDHVGCGYCFFKNLTKATLQYQKFYVCHYGPAGNFIGVYPYKTGAQGCENLCE